MAFYNRYKLFISTLFFPVFLMPLALSNPILESPLDKFIRSLKEKECNMPKELILPFENSSDPSPFSYLYTPLSECRTPDALTDYEANMLCTEIFDVLKNITCVRYNQSLPTIESNHLSENVCHDFESLKGILPQKDNYLSGRLSDKIICKISCSAEKYEKLCKTLLWSYDTLMKIKHALSSEEQIQKNENVDQVSSEKDKVSSSVKPTSGSTNVIPESLSQNMKELGKSKVYDGLNPAKKPNLNPIAQESQNNVSGDTGEVTSQTISSKIDSSNSQIQNEAINNKPVSAVKNVANAIPLNKSEPEDEKLTPEVPEINVKPNESKNLSSLNSHPESIDDDENKIDVDEKLHQKEVKDSDPEANLDKNSLTSNVSGRKEKENQNVKNKTTDNLPANANKDVDSKQVSGENKDGSKPSEKSLEPGVPAAENDNELKNDNFPDEEVKPQVKQTSLENQEEKDIGKPKETDYEGANEVLSNTDSKLPEPPTQSALPDEDIEHQEDKDQYPDNENEADYVKSEYENPLDVPSKNKETEVKSSIAVGSNQMTNGYGSNIRPKANIGQIEEIAMIAPFPEQEDSHFFFYFLSIVLIIMAGYLIFHNKQKIIALIVEGRHERRRRSGVGYKKLDTK